MGIKGIYKEIGPGERVALSKLAIDHLEKTGKPFRLAIDFSIWQYQVQAARGGSNPAIRTLFYRLLRLMSLAIDPIFVFDGPNKPAFKRNKRSGRQAGTSVATAMAKRMIRLFGFASHDAPGEAEAECALLQREGVVDAVLSEDVDTIMFGCRRTLRNWTAEGAKGSKTPTHVSMYDVDQLNSGSSGLDREGMVLVALMSGGDYLPEGVPGCGPKVACEAARAGFGRDLCRIKKSDKEALAAWKQNLLEELQTNKSKFFRTKHKALEIPEDFPDMEILRYYTHPVVSQPATVERVRARFPGTQPVDIPGLREFVQETFDWTYKTGAVKLIRVLAPSLLVQLMLRRMTSLETLPDDAGLRQAEESALVKAISTRRAHFSTDATPELRMAFVPVDIVGLDLDAEIDEPVEEFGRTGIALNSDDEFEDGTGEEVGEQAAGAKKFDPLQPELAWIPETLAKLSVPLTVESFEGKQRAKAEKAVQAAAAKATRKAKKNDMPVGALDKYVKTTKATTSKTSKRASATPAPTLLGSPVATIPAFLSTQDAARPQLVRAMSTKASQPAAESARSKQPKKSSKAPATKPTAAVNPWTHMGSQVSPRVTKVVTSTSKTDPSGFASQPIVISSSPAPPSPSPSRNARLTSQSTPTKTLYTQSPSTQPLLSSDPFGSPPSPVRQKHDTTTRKAPGKRPSTSPPAPTSKPRTFKRAKESAKGRIGGGVSIAQTSISAYGRVTKATCSTALVGAKADKPALPIELLGDDDDDDDDDDNGGNGDDTLPSLDGFLQDRRTVSVEKTTVLTVTRQPVSVIDDDDPFVSSPPKLRQRSLKSRSKTPERSRSLTKGRSKSPTTNIGIGGCRKKTIYEIDDDDPFMTSSPEYSGTCQGYIDGKGLVSSGDLVLNGKSKKIWRLSDISVVDLTED